MGNEKHLQTIKSAPSPSGTLQDTACDGAREQISAQVSFCCLLIYIENHRVIQQELGAVVVERDIAEREAEERRSGGKRGAGVLLLANGLVHTKLFNKRETTPAQ